MRLIRHCRESLPGGELLWRRLARMAGYKGPLFIKGFGTDRQPMWHALATGRIILGYTQGVKGKVKKIVVFLGRPEAPCARFWPTRIDPIFTLAHELGHAWAIRHGVKATEDHANRYAKRLLRRAGLGDQEGRSDHSRTLRPMGSLPSRPSSR